jgi:prevent-host-death family protein
MKRVRIAELKDRLSAHLRAVERGGEVEVTDRDRPIARIVPVREPSVGIRIIPAARPFPALRTKRYPPARWAVSSTVLLREERGKR